MVEFEIVEGTSQYPKMIYTDSEIEPAPICCPLAGDPKPWCQSYMSQRCNGTCPVEILRPVSDDDIPPECFGHMQRYCGEDGQDFATDDWIEICGYCQHSDKCFEESGMTEPDYNKTQ